MWEEIVHLWKTAISISYNHNATAQEWTTLSHMPTVRGLTAKLAPLHHCIGSTYWTCSIYLQSAENTLFSFENKLSVTNWFYSSSSNHYNIVSNINSLQKSTCSYKVRCHFHNGLVTLPLDLPIYIMLCTLFPSRQSCCTFYSLVPHSHLHHGKTAISLNGLPVGSQWPLTPVNSSTNATR